MSENHSVKPVILKKFPTIFCKKVQILKWGSWIFLKIWVNDVYMKWLTTCFNVFQNLTPGLKYRGVVFGEFLSSFQLWEAIAIKRLTRLLIEIAFWKGLFLHFTAKFGEKNILTFYGPKKLDKSEKCGNEGVLKRRLVIFLFFLGRVLCFWTLCKIPRKFHF